MSLYLILTIITVFLALAFVLLHLAAAVSAILKGKKSLGTGFIIIGAIVGILALLLVMVNRPITNPCNGGNGMVGLTVGCC